MAKKQTSKTPKESVVEDEEIEIDDDLDSAASDDDLNDYSDDDFEDLDEEGSARPRRASIDDLKAIELEVALRANPKRAKAQKKGARSLDGVSSIKDLEAPEVALKIWKKLEKQHKDATPQPYSVEADYSLDDIVDHPTFGRGYVVEITSNTKFILLFEVGLKRLMYNLKKS